MSNKKTTALYGFIILMGVLPLLILGYSSYQSRHFSCESEITIIRDDVSYDVIMHYTFDGRAGRYHSTGLMHENGKPMIQTNRSVDFNYTYINENMILVSLGNNKDPKDLNLLLPGLPDFYRYSGRGISLRVVRENASSYLFMHNNAPLFYCTRIERD